jgi:hypothetical protein
MENKKARPWDIFNKNIEKVGETISKERMSICNACTELLPTGNCKKCGCFMSLKTKLPHAFCPLNKWGTLQIGYEELINE